MQDFSVNSDDGVKRMGMIDKDTILKFVTQSQIFKMVFGFMPQQYSYIKSPFRVDDDPNCWFEMYDNKLIFKDFGNPIKSHYDCFDAVQSHFNLPNFYETLDFINTTLIEGKELEEVKEKYQSDSSKKKSVEIITAARNFDMRDATFWSDFEISSENLIEDQVFALQKYKLLNTKAGNFVSRVNVIGYAFTEFEEGRKKLYFPKKIGNGKFITNCTKHDIGALQHLPPYGKKLVISKSYKDCRILRNLGLHAIWFQNEGMIPDLKLLLPILLQYREVIIWFDNDRAGIQAAKKVAAILRMYLQDRVVVRTLWLPEELLDRDITDPGDFVKKIDSKELRTFISQRI